MNFDGEYTCRMMHFPGDIYAILRVSPDGYGNIYVNDQLSPAAKKRAFEHELKHFLRGDMDNSLSIQEVEG